MVITDRRIALVCNTLAGKGKALAVTATVAEELTQRSICFSVYTSEWPSTFAGFTDVFVVGGDGTLNYFINHYPGLFLPLTVFKGGSGNDFAWKLYGGISVKDQIQYVLHATPKAVDAGRCNGRYFINGVGIGFDGEIVKAREVNHLLYARYGSYMRTVLKKLFFYRERHMQLEYDNQVRKDKLLMVSIANGSRYGNGFMIAPTAVVTDGLLDLVTIGRIHPFKRLFYLSQVQKGLHMHYSFVTTAQVKKVIIQTEELTDAHIDGELMQGQSFDIEVLPKQFLFRY
jgi:YegS/Rv2252/BmrU family lipid kinase